MSTGRLHMICIMVHSYLEEPSVPSESILKCTDSDTETLTCIPSLKCQVLSAPWRTMNHFSHVFTMFSPCWVHFIGFSTGALPPVPHTVSAAPFRRMRTSRTSPRTPTTTSPTETRSRRRGPGHTVSTGGPWFYMVIGCYRYGYITTSCEQNRTIIPGEAEVKLRGYEGLYGFHSPSRRVPTWFWRCFRCFLSLFYQKHVCGACVSFWGGVAVSA